jgi:hypothetical protein
VRAVWVVSTCDGLVAKVPALACVLNGRPSHLSLLWSPQPSNGTFSPLGPLAALSPCISHLLSPLCVIPPSRVALLGQEPSVDIPYPTGYGN